MAGLLVCAAGASAQSVDRAHVDEGDARVEPPEGTRWCQVAVSPDGKLGLLWITGGRGGDGQILVAPIGDLKKTQRVTAAAKADQHCAENDLAWEPDSKALAFFSDCASSNGQLDLYLSRVDGNRRQSAAGRS